ncbi:MAG: exosortase H [Bacteroidales bacterium]|jgi:exosortase H (IPTLxxWG-CTERM-specific)|nr:exosortase H [Bacteroidales bacterium]NCU36327.1 exosortase H [Candidatus Falkowbacteria bacterium]MDD3526958.1 exosortase H [Bacteroidales bacterium]MDD4177765.1 exosortase H [Bacteroidales bacterium]MDD4742108.1 exosortase H [Bacteroidales bacterium]
MKETNLTFSISNWYQRHLALIFAGLVALQLLLFYLIYRNPWVEQAIFTPLVNFYALLAGKVLTFMAFAVSVSGDMVSSPEFSVSIKKGCDAAEPMAIFIAGIVAFPAQIKDKLSGLAIGLLILFFLNIIRIITLFIVGVYAPDFFESMHLAVWQVAFIIVAIVLWFLWLKYVSSKRTKS